MMAKRLATIYEYLKLEATPVQMERIIQRFEQLPSSRVCVLDNGDAELTLRDKDQVIPLIFHSHGRQYVFEGSFLVKDARLANAIRKLIKKCGGRARARRIYESFAMQYEYADGMVVKIQEFRGNQVRLVYEYKDPREKFQRSRQTRGAEDQIAWVKLQIDQLLEQRNKGAHLEEIDRALQKLVRELVALEQP